MIELFFLLFHGNLLKSQAKSVATNNGETQKTREDILKGRNRENFVTDEYIDDLQERNLSNQIQIASLLVNKILLETLQQESSGQSILRRRSHRSARRFRGGGGGSRGELIPYPRVG